MTARTSRLALAAVVLTAAVSSSTTVAQERPAASRPNILFIFSDDHASQAISAYNHPLRLVQTPRLDSLAAQGMLFERAMVPNSLCGPSRAALLTGKYSHLNGFYHNGGNVFDGSQQTFPKLMQKGGYQTAVVGKWHLTSDPTGFDYWDILPGQGVYYNPPMIKNGEKVQRTGYTTDIITDLAIDWLKGRDRSRPFVLMTHHKAPHRNFSPSLKYLGWNKDRVFSEPETLFDDYRGRGKAEHEQDMSIEKTMNDNDLKLGPAPTEFTPEQKKVWDDYYGPRNDAFRKANLTGRDLIRWRYQRYMHDYLGAVLSIDEGVGRLLDYLQADGLADNTIVIYSSDQGFYLGEHGWFDKRWIYEESLTTPLLVRWPKVTRPGSRNRDIVSTLDLPETFLQAAGLPTPSDMQGRSLVPLLRGTTPSNWRTSFYYHYYEHPAVHNVAKHYGIVTDRYKLFHFYEPGMHYWSLVDRLKDPRELTNLYDDPAYLKTVEQLHGELNRLRRQLRVPDRDAPESLTNEAGRVGGAGPTDPVRR